jgi:hypothetical protein
MTLEFLKIQLRRVVEDFKLNLLVFRKWDLGGFKIEKLPSLRI